MQPEKATTGNSNMGGGGNHTQRQKEKDKNIHQLYMRYRNLTS